VPISPGAYGAIARRHIEAARLLTSEGLNEVAVFHCYHAFESLACAALLDAGRAVPRSHERKIRSFLAAHRRQPYQPGASALAEVLIPLRNLVLYPDEDEAGGKESITAALAERLLRRVEGLSRLMLRALPT
jgi:HEPN domain-containing protein